MKYIFLTILVLGLSCSSKRSESTDESKSVQVATTQVKNESTDVQQTNQFTIKTANYRFQVENVEKSTKDIEKIVKLHQAFIADMNQVTTGSEISNTLIIRVPSQNFEKLIEALGKDAIFTNFKRISTEDVTEEFVDIDSRLKTKKEVRDRYVDILKNKAKTVEDVLKAEEQIRILQEEIEAKEGRLKYLQSRVSQSTINLEIYQRVDYRETPDTYEKPYLTKIKQGLTNGWTIVTSVVLVLINIWPIIIVGGLIYWRRTWIKEKIFKK